MRTRRRGSHRASGSVIAALIIGCCVGAVADWQLRENGPPRPVRPTEPAIQPAELAAARAHPSLSRPPAAESTAAPPDLPAVEELAGRDLRLPIDSMDPKPLKGAFDERRRGGTRAHEAVDILAPRNTPVHAVERGTIAKLFFSKAGGKTIYQFDPSGRFCYYYAHLERYAEGIREGATLSRGEVIGYVGTSGNAPPNTPHLHFAIFQLTPARHWWEGTAIDPYPVFQRGSR